MKYILLIFSFFLFCGNGFAQKYWELYTFGNICSFRVPPILEMRDLDSDLGHTYNEAINSFCIALGQTPAERKVTFQPEGMDSDDPEKFSWATSVYARIIVEDLEDEYPSQRDIATATAADMRGINALFKKEAIESCSFFCEPKDIVWYPLLRTKIGGKYALVSRYKRPSLEGGMVYVRIYKFFFATHLLRFIVSYRERESALWKKDLDKFIGTLSFN